MSPTQGRHASQADRLEVRVSLSKVGILLKEEAMTEVGKTQLGLGTPDGCAIVFGLCTAWLEAEQHNVLLALDAAGAQSKTNRSNSHKAV